MSFVPCGDRVIVKREVADDMTKGGLYIPESAKQESQKGTVVYVGKGRKGPNGDFPFGSDFKAGDIVVFNKYTGSDVIVEGIKLTVLREDEIIAKVEG